MKALCVALFVLGSVSRAADPAPLLGRMSPTWYVLSHFTGDLNLPWSSESPYEGSSIPYLAPASLLKQVRAKLAEIVPGSTRAQLDRAGFVENGGANLDEFVLPNPTAHGHKVTIRILPRSDAGPENTSSDPKQRQAWLTPPSPTPITEDVIIRHEVTIRVSLRPAAMPESVYADPTRRRAWLTEYSPAPTPDDVVMRVSKPFFSQLTMD